MKMKSLYLWVAATLLLFSGFAKAGEMEEFSIVVLPDTQVYAQAYPKHFYTQTQWVADQAEVLNIKYVIHLGDITESNIPIEWDVSRRAMDTLNGTVPYALALGNHDYGDGGYSNNRNTFFNDAAYYGPGTPYASQPTIGGFYPAEPEKTENSWHTFRVSNEDFLILILEWGPRDAVVEWAGTVVENHSDHHVILITHAYLHYDGTRFDWDAKGDAQPYSPRRPEYKTSALPGGCNDGEDLWQKLVKKHENFILVMNGHDLGDGPWRLTSTGDYGNAVHQMMINYQGEIQGGRGKLRILTFKPDKKTVEVKTFSAVRKRYSTKPGQQFNLKLSPSL